jgi:Flp pilus assembly protein TadD
MKDDAMNDEDRSSFILSSLSRITMTRHLFILFALASLAACDLSPMQSSPDSEKDPMVAAERLEKNGNLAGAAVLYQQAAAKEDAPPAAYSKLAAVLRKQGRSADAVTVLREALLKKPGNTAIMSQLGYALIASGEPQGAVSVFDELTAIEPANAMHYNGKAVAFDNAGNHVAAQEIYQKAMSLSPDSVPIKNNYAMSLILDKKFDEAIAMLEPIAQKEGSNATVRQNLALAYGLKGDSAQAFTINRKDLTPQQAEENQRFYEQYERLNKKK